MTNYGFIVPVFNHPHHLDQLVATLDQFDLQIILINDGSDAHCTQKMRELDQKYIKVHLLEHPYNQGKGQAVITGLIYADQLGLTHALQIDCDGQHHWDDIEKFLTVSHQYPDRVIIGQPIFDDSIPKERLYGRYLTHILVWIQSLSFEIKDSMCGFRVYPLAPTLKLIQASKFQPRMGFDTEILVRLKWENLHFINVPTPVIYPDDGISHYHLLRDNIGVTQAHIRLVGGMLKRLPRLLKQKIKG
ncbi:glycosyltransferase family 2 protein [Acinetobacter soli]|uniref:glycosyltransferase family 2 protein n=1 Tax=Acinetobacter soli TaxID=487316 RepID=UPI0012508574|nr:glycosyltransferase family 2 protein [Acinetobacter soli]WEH91303.1 glycosyltransferase family 2 protein [Acinetobacter soli]WEH97258.1 glycosyltransferase family 2 protein [Acinetobacter soli]WEH99816.1 glycosyltransferase family 2 protein [Acinetobacter soli]